MAQWIADSTSEKRIKASPDPRHLRTLSQGAVVVQRQFAQAFRNRLRTAVPGEITTGGPLGNVKNAWGKAERARESFVKRLLDEDKASDSIWGHL